MSDPKGAPGPKGKRPKGGGRPPLPPNRIRSINLRLRVSSDELAELRVAATNCGLPLTTYVRVEALKRRIRPLAIPKANLIYVDELNRLGNNLNQLLVLIYTNRAPFGLLTTLQQLQKAVDEVRTMMLLAAGEIS